VFLETFFWNRWMPVRLVLYHTIQGDNGFAHASGNSHLVGFSRFPQSGIEGAYYRVETDCGHSGHIEYGSDALASTPYSAFTPELPAVSVKRGYPNESRKRFRGDGAQFWNGCQKDSRGDRTNAFETL